MTTHKLALSFILYASFGYAFADEYMKIKRKFVVYWNSEMHYSDISFEIYET